MVDISIIRYDKDKAEDVCIVHNSAFKSYIEDFGMLYGYRNLNPNEIRNWIKNPENKIWLAYVDNEPVGYVHCSQRIENKDNEILTMWFVETFEEIGQSRIAVIPSFRKKGIGKNLVEHAIENYKKVGAEIVIVSAYSDNESATDLLTSLGFKHFNPYYYKRFSKNDPFEVVSVLATFDLRQPLPKITLNSEVNVRIISENDLPAMKDIFGKARPDIWGSNPTKEHVIGWYNEGWGEVTLVAEFEGKTVGCMEYTSAGLIGIPGVLPQYQKKGIGSTLFYHLLKSMKEKGLFKALTDSGYVPERREAIRMYKRFNFDLSRKLWPWIKII